MNKIESTKSTKKSTTTTSGKHRQPPRKFETLEVSNDSPVVMKTMSSRKEKIYFVV